MRILSYLSSYLWPSNEVPNSLDIKRRVVISLSSNAELVTVTQIVAIVGYHISRSLGSLTSYTAVTSHI